MNIGYVFLIIMASAAYFVSNIPTPDEMIADFQAAQKFYTSKAYDQALEAYTEVGVIESRFVDEDKVIVEFGDMQLRIKDATLYQSGNSYYKMAEDELQNSFNAAEDEERERADRLALEYVENAIPQFSAQGTYMSYGSSLVRVKPQSALLEMQLPAKATVVGWEEDESGIYFSYSKNNRLTLARAALPSGSPLGRAVAQGPEEAESVELSPHARWVVWGTRATKSASAVATLENLGSGARLEVAGRPAGRAWSPDEQYVWMWTSWRQMVVVDLAHLRVIRELGTSDFSGQETLPFYHWSLDGKRVTLATHKVVRDKAESRREDTVEWGPIHLWVANADGSGLRRIAESAMADFTDFNIGGWTADGQIIVAVEKRKIISIDPDTGVQTEILTSSVPPENSEAEGRY